MKKICFILLFSQSVYAKTEFLLADKLSEISAQHHIIFDAQVDIHDDLISINNWSDDLNEQLKIILYDYNWFAFHQNDRITKIVITSQKSQPVITRKKEDELKIAYRYALQENTYDAWFKLKTFTMHP